MYEEIERYIDRLMEESTPEQPFWNIESRKGGKPPHWNYVDGCMLTALLEMHAITGERRYFDFAEHFVDFYINDDGSILGYQKENYSLDDVNEGRVLFALYEQTKKEKYRLAIERLHEQLKEQPRSETGNFWHKKIYPNQVWLDGIYMAQVFSTLYAKQYLRGDFSDVVSQIKNVERHMRDEKTGLYFHGWDCTKKSFWADKETGLSQSFWLRAIGWFAVALADLTEITEGKAREEIAGIGKRLMQDIRLFRDRESGMFYQVPNRPGAEGNYLETSGSAMLAYAMLKGARLRVLEPEYAELGKSTFEGICNRYLEINEAGERNLGGICLVAGLGPEQNRRRDGSYEYYISEPVVENDAKGVAPFLLCYTELLRLLRSKEGTDVVVKK